MHKAEGNRSWGEEEKESELVGFLSALRTQDDSSYVTWRCISIDGSERV